MERTLLMTGASRGIGRHAAVRLLHDDADLHLVVLSRGRASLTLGEELARSSGNPNVSVVDADLSSLAQTRAAAGAVEDRLRSGALPPLHGLVLNAGLQLTSTTGATVDGVETTFAVNVLANYVLIRLLADRLHAPARIIVTSSDTHAGAGAPVVPKPRWTGVGALAIPGTDRSAATARAGRRAYSTSKLAVIYLVHALARRLPAGVDAYAFNPGLVPDTDLVRSAGPVTRAVFRTLTPALTLLPFAQSARAAGDQLALLATGPRPAGSGAYIDRTAETRSSADSYDETREEALWRHCADLAGLAEPAGLDLPGGHDRRPPPTAPTEAR
jgi:NAD(P)-dependent dehydrogenase (short-subunit alcohol dehydrogenase family)